MDSYILKPTDTEVNIRLDLFILSKIGGLSRSYINKIIKDGLVKVNGSLEKPSYKLKFVDIIEVHIPAPVEPEILAEKIDIDIIFEDDYVLVVNKPQGMVVHPAHGNDSGTLVNALLYYCSNLSGINGVKRPGIVHRLDKDTSGLIMVAKTNEAHIALSKQLKERTIIRKYMALVEGIIKTDSGIIETFIGRHPNDRKRMAVLKKGGRVAITRYNTIEYFDNNTLIEAQLETGRTHQIRVHMSYLGHPVVGDLLYGYKKQKYQLKGQLLHSYILGFEHPFTGEYMEFYSPVPCYFEEVLNRLKQSL